MNKDKTNLAYRKRWFRCVKTVLKLFVKRPTFHFVGDEVTAPALVLSNHVGAKAPLSWEIYSPFSFRFWGTHEMNSGLKNVYRYLSTTYYQEKKHWKPLPAKLFSIIAAPFANMFYKGMKLISTYNDARLRHTIQESIKTVESGNSLIIFPEDSSSGYHDVLTKYFAGFTLIGDVLLKRGIDIPVYVAYLQKKTSTFIIDKPILYSVMRNGKSRSTVAEEVLTRANGLASYEIV